VGPLFDILPGAKKSRDRKSIAAYESRFWFTLQVGIPNYGKKLLFLLEQ
jgi:hypothetical protein